MSLSSVIVAVAAWPVATHALAVTLGGTSWRLSINIGREPGTAMPREWAASGARLAFPLTVTFNNGACDSAIRPVDEPLLGSVVQRLTPLGRATFVSMNGEQEVPVMSGGWSETELVKGVSGGGRAGQPGAYALRFFLTFPEGATRNDVVLLPGRVYFTTGYYLDETLDAAERAVASARAEVDALQDEILQADADAKQGSPFSRAAALRRQVTLFDKRTFALERLQEAEATAPKSGTIAGPAGVQVSRAGGLTVKRRGGLLGLREEYHILGTFSMSPSE